MSNFIRQVRDNWVILCFIVALIVSWTNTNSRLASAEGQVEELSSVVNQINNINVTLGRMDEKLQAIDEKLDYHLGL